MSWSCDRLPLMRVFRFDEEVSVPAPRGGSGLRIARLTAGGSRAVVEVLHLDRGAHLVDHETPTRRFFGVVAGSGWVTDGDGARRELGCGYGVLWEPGESWEAASDAGLTAISVEGEFELVATAVTRDIVVSDYDPVWPSWFEQLRDRLWPAVAPIAIRLDHVGSTSVPGLAAKPIIDIDIVIRSEGEVAAVIECLQSIGYRWLGNLGVVGREAFEPPADRLLPPHHLYVVVENNKAHLDHWLLRDLLRADPEARYRYAALKRRNCELANGDMDFYVAAKAALVAELLTRARAERGFAPATYWQPELGPDQ
jgi:GrpB-like predicted nucleotidyltransferase (UPF0157 family)